MQNQWFISIMSRSHSFNSVLVYFFENIKKLQKARFELFEKVQKSAPKAHIFE